MPQPTPFHACTAAACKSADWRNWAGYMAAATYEYTHEFEYYAIRNGAALIDVTPLYKYEITGSDAANLIDRIITRNAHRCKIGQALYTPWCDDAGKMMDDGTVQRFAEDRFRITSARPALRWFMDCAVGMDVSVRDISKELGALSLQGPTSREILKAVVRGVDMDKLKFFYLAEGTIDNFPLVVSRTGYTGDLGYELWVEKEHAPQLWQILMEKGRGYGITPTGLDAMDIARIEAGLLLNDVDYISSEVALIESRKSSPYEAGLGWAVNLKKKRFIGRQALAREKENDSVWQFRGLDIDWETVERLYAKADLPPMVAGRASRLAVPVYSKNGYGTYPQIGQATSIAFSPLLKKYIALATLQTDEARPGTEVEIEITVEFSRYKAKATVVKLPFFNPPRKRA